MKNGLLQSIVAVALVTSIDLLAAAARRPVRLQPVEHAAVSGTALASDAPTLVEAPAVEVAAARRRFLPEVVEGPGGVRYTLVSGSRVKNPANLTQAGLSTDAERATVVEEDNGEWCARVRHLIYSVEALVSHLTRRENPVAVSEILYDALMSDDIDMLVQVAENLPQALSYEEDEAGDEGETQTQKTIKFLLLGLNSALYKIENYSHTDRISTQMREFLRSVLASSFETFHPYWEPLCTFLESPEARVLREFRSDWQQELAAKASSNPT